MALVRNRLLENVHSPPGASSRPALPTGVEPLAECQVRVQGRDLTALKSCVLLTIKDVMQLTGLGRSSIYKELQGPLASVRVGRRRLVPAQALEAWRASLTPSLGRFDAA